MSKWKLTQKQDQSCYDYIETGNKTEAYRRNYSTKGMTEATLNVEAVKHFNIPKISKRVDELRKEVEKKNEVNQDKIIKELANMSFFDIRNLFDENGNLKNPTLLDESCGKAISAIKQVSRHIKVGDGETELETTTEYKLNSKNTSIDQLCKILGYYEKDNGQKKQSIEVTVNADTIKKVITNFDDEY